MKLHPVVIVFVAMNTFLSPGLAFLDHVKDVPQPFRVIWNYKDTPCKKHHIDFHLSDYGIESNKNGFIGETIALLYSQKFGLWPYIDFKDGQRPVWINGGMPQYFDLSAHLKAFRTDLRPYVHGGTSGFGIIDMELWKPVFNTNNMQLKRYIHTNNTIGDPQERKKNPRLSQTVIRPWSEHTWNAAARKTMMRSLAAAMKTWPDMKWGYYGYPLYRSKNNQNNDRTAWLFNISTALYPSIYIKTFNKSLQETKQKIIDLLAETYRVRAEHGQPDTPIMAYTTVQSGTLGKFYKEWLELALKLPVEMGVDGLILWTSYKEFSDPSKVKCTRELEYIRTTLGPKVEHLLTRMKNCSIQLCQGQGRCVRKEYSKNIKYVKDRGVSTSGTCTKTSSSSKGSSVLTYFLAHYDCQCYKSWFGDDCSQTMVK